MCINVPLQGIGEQVFSSSDVTKVSENDAQFQDTDAQFQDTMSNRVNILCNVHINKNKLNTVYIDVLIRPIENLRFLSMRVFLVNKWDTDHIIIWKQILGNYSY